jgi:hypothetical protein
MYGLSEEDQNENFPLVPLTYNNNHVQKLQPFDFLNKIITYKKKKKLQFSVHKID